MMTSLFSRRHYEFLAEEIAFLPNPLEIGKALAPRFKQDNPKFDTNRFLEAVRVKAAKVTEWK